MWTTERLVDQFIMALPCRHPAPYPSPTFAGQSLRNADVLLDAFADGAAAELTAVSQYVVHHFTIEDPCVSDMVLCIALVEMKHLSLIGEAIQSLGGEPRYWRTNRGWWKGSEVAYGDSAIQKILLDIEGEQAAINAYRRMIADVDDPGIVALLERIIQDELAHLSLFHQALQMLRTPQS